MLFLKLDVYIMKSVDFFWYKRWPKPRTKKVLILLE